MSETKDTVGIFNENGQDVLFPYNSGPGFLLKAGKVTQVPAEVVGLILRKLSSKGIRTEAPTKAPAPVEAPAVEEAPVAPEAPKETKKARRPGKAKR